MTSSPDGPAPPEPSLLLARWRDRYRVHDVAGLVGLYDAEAFLVGSTPTTHVGRDQISEYFESLGPMPDAEVDFSQVTGRLLRPDVVLALAQFSGGGRSLGMRPTRIWSAHGSEWLISGHHASPIGDLRKGSVQT